MRAEALTGRLRIGPTMSFSLSPFRRLAAPPVEHPGASPEAMRALESAPLPAEAPRERRITVLATTIARARRRDEVRPTHHYRGALAAAVLLLAAAALTWFAATGVLTGIEQSAAWLQQRDNMLRRALVVCALLAAAMLAVIVAWGRATAPGRPVSLADGRGTIAVSEIAEWLRTVLEQRPGIHSAAVQVENRHADGVRIDVRVRVGPDAQIDATLDEVDDVAEELIHRRLGVAMDGPPLVEVVYDELKLGVGTPHD